MCFEKLIIRQRFDESAVVGEYEFRVIRNGGSVVTGCDDRRLFGFLWLFCF